MWTAFSLFNVQPEDKHLPSQFSIHKQTVILRLFSYYNFLKMNGIMCTCHALPCEHFRHQIKQMVHFKKTDSVYGTSWPPDGTMQDNQFVTWLFLPTSFMAKEDCCCCCLCYFYYTTQQGHWDAIRGGIIWEQCVTHSSYGKLPMLLTPKVGIWSQLIHNYLSIFTCNMWEKTKISSYQPEHEPKFAAYLSLLLHIFTYLQIIAPYYLESAVISEPVAKYLLATIIFFSNLIIDIRTWLEKKN